MSACTSTDPWHVDIVSCVSERHPARSPRYAAAHVGLDILVLGDANPDLVLSGEDVVPAFGQAERLVDEARW